MTTLALLICAFSFQGAGPENLAKDLQTARVNAGDSYQRFLRDATFIVGKDLTGQDWAPTKKTLIAQGIKVEENDWGFARLTVPDTDFIASSNVVNRLDLGVMIKPRTSASAASVMAIEYPTVRLRANPEQEFTALSMGSVYAKDTVLGKVFERPALVAAARDFPIIDEIRLEYHFKWFPRSAYPHPESLPYVFEATVSLGKGPKWHHSGVTFNYSAQSNLDAEADFKGHSVDPNYVSKDTIGDIEIPGWGRTEKDFLRVTSWNSINDFVIERITPYTMLDRGTKAYSRGDLATLPTSTTALALSGGAYKPGDLDLLSRFQKLERLDLSNIEPFIWASANDLLVIGKLKNLRSLDLPIADAPLSLPLIKAIAGLPHLESFSVFNSTLTSKEFGLLCGIKTLKNFEARFCKGLDDEALTSLARNHRLRSLDILGSTGFTEKSFRLFAATNLHDLNAGPLAASSVAVLPEIVKKSSLDNLGLTECAINNDLVSTIAKKHGMKNVNFSKCTGLNDVMIQQLSALDRPDWIGFYECPNVSQDAVKRLMNQFKGKYQILQT